MAASKMDSTLLEKSKQSKKIKGEIEEKLDAMGQENEDKAVQWVVEENKSIDENKERVNQNNLEILTKKRTTFKTYYGALASHVELLMANYIDWPKGFTWEVGNSVRGISATVRDPKGETYSRGFKPNGEPKYDYHAMKVLVWQADNLVEELREKYDPRRTEEDNRSDSRTDSIVAGKES